MKLFSSVVSISAVLLSASALLLSGCSANIVATLDTEGYRAVLTDGKCKNEVVLKRLKEEGEMAKLMGVEPAEVDKITSEFKAGSVHLKGTGEDRQLCYRDQKDGTVYIIDDKGGEGVIALNPEPKKP